MKASSNEESSNDENTSGNGDAVFDRIRTVFGETIYEALMSKFYCSVFVLRTQWSLSWGCLLTDKLAPFLQARTDLYSVLDNIL